MSPSRLLIAQTIAAMRIALAKRGIKPTRYPHLKRYAKALVAEVHNARTLRRL